MEPDLENLKDELLEIPREAEETPKLNTKAHLVNKILEVAERDGIPLEFSTSKLKRMSKAELANILASMIEKGMRRKMAAQVGCDSDADDRTIALGALRMLHDVVAVGAEKGANVFLEPRGYQITGFSENLKEPTVSRCIDQCLQEIADENSELLELVQSPYTRLAIAWGGALAFSCRKTIKSHASELGRPALGAQNSIRRRRSRGPATGEVHADPSPPRNDVVEV